MSYLTYYEEIDGGYVAFGSNPKGEKITGRGTKACDDAGKARMETVPGKDYILLPLWTIDPLISQGSKNSQDDQEKEDNVNNTNNVNVVGTNGVNAVSANTNNELLFDPNMAALEDTSTLNFSSNYEDDDEEADMNNMDTTIQMDVKSAFLYGKIEKEKELCNAFKKMMHEKFQMSSIGELTFFLRLQVKQKQDGIFISQDKYVAEILKKYGFSKVKNASKPMKTQKPLLKDEDGQPKFSLWYPKDSPFDLVAYTDSDYAGASLDRKSTTGGCKFLGCRLISWQCKKQTVIENSITEAEYVASSSCYGQVLWIQNQLLDYGKSVELREL
nr:hypothetical protein [Tanacetum cinerariifolium]